MVTSNLSEETFVLSLSSSPRISVSNNASPATLRPSSSFSDTDFEFSLAPSSLHPSPADELFSRGFLLPLPLKSSFSSSAVAANPAPSPLPQISNAARINPKKPFAPFHRSFSLSCSRAKSKLSVIFPFPLSRSHSAGSNSFSKQRLNRAKPHASFSGDVDGYEGARVRPRHGGAFGVLLCSCWSKGGWP